MQIGMVGLGRMGGNMARRLLRGGHEVVAYAADANAVRQLAGEGAVGALTLDDFVAKLKAPRVAWVMVPAGPPTEQVVTSPGVWIPVTRSSTAATPPSRTTCAGAGRSASERSTSWTSARAAASGGSSAGKIGRAHV